MQSTPTDTADLYEPLHRDLRDLYELERNFTNLRGREDEGIQTLRAALRGNKLNLTYTAFSYLATTSREFIVALHDDLLYLAGSDNYTLQVCDLLGRFPHDEARKLVPPAVAKRLEADDVDYGDWYRMADLLRYLGLYDALRDLVARARDHIDGDVRELADSYGDV